MNPEKDKLSTTTDGNPPRPGWEDRGAPAPIDTKTGQHEAYYILSKEERAKGFVRPVRRSYRHVGVRPQYPLRDLDPGEHERYDQFGYVKFEEYPSGGAATGRYWTEAQLNSGCGTETNMSVAIAETYARDPKYYGATFCVNCRSHFPVGEFVWETGEKVGT